MGLISQTIKDFTLSLQRAIGEVPILCDRITKDDKIVVWYGTIVTDPDYDHELNLGKASNVLAAKIKLIDQLTSDYSATFIYWNASGIEIRFFWNGKEFERV